MSKTAEWMEILAGLRARRLAVLDDLARGVEINTADTKVQEALGWLVYHRFVWHDGRAYVARETAAARELWLKHGPAKDEAADVARSIDYAEEMRKAAAAAPEIPPEIRAKMDADRAAAQANRPVHPHQVQFFSEV